MKKTIIVLGSALFLAASTYAQTNPEVKENTPETLLKSKKGELILPEAGDWSIGIDATPFLEYAGNLMSGNVAKNAAPTWGFHNGVAQTIIGKYFKDEKTAYRVYLRINTSNVNQIKEINTARPLPVVAFFPDTVSTTEDSYKQSSSLFVIGGGIEKRRGSTRLQGFYGAEACLIIQGATNHTYNYGNALTQNPAMGQPDIDPDDVTYSTDWGVGNLDNAIPGTAGVTGARMLSNKVAGGFGVGARAFIGAEYFVLPKISIAGEFGWGVSYRTLGKSSTEWEAEGNLADGSQAAAKITETHVNKNRNFLVDTENGIPSGTLKISFHF